MTLPPNNDPRTWTVGDWCATYEGSLVDLAAELGVTRQALLHLRAGKHRRPPVDLLERLAAALARRSTFRARFVTPSHVQLVALWYREQGLDFDADLALARSDAELSDAPVRRSERRS